MKILCELETSNSPHLYQLYTGFARLHENGIIDLKLKKSNNQDSFYKPIVRLKINKKINVIYDLLDGFNWISGSKDDNLMHFKNEFKNVDYYFKRSYNKELLNYSPTGCSIFPLGLFYRENQPDCFKNSVSFKTRQVLDILKIKKIKHKKNQYVAPPIIEELNAMLFTRLWDPQQVSDTKQKEERIQINTNRIEAIEACRKEFKDRFYGGLSNSVLAKKEAAQLILPDSHTNRKNYLKRVKSTPICIVNTGLHNSIGGRFAEAVAASRAIISEPLHYDPTGDFLKDKNYLTFTNTSQLLEKVDALLSNKNKTQQMMLKNYFYYNNYLKPEQLVLNTIIKIYE